MTRDRLAAWLDSYREDLRKALLRASEQGYQVVHGSATDAALDPRDFGPSARRHLRKYLSDLGLELGGVALLYPGLGLADPAHANERVERLKGTLELCADLRVPTVAVSVSGFGDPRTDALARELLAVVADQADRVGVATSISTPAGDVLRTSELVRALGCRYLRVALDTAHWPAATDTAGLIDLLGITYLRDVRWSGSRFEEVPFGQGSVDFPALLAAIAAAPGDVPLVIRHDGQNGVDALRQGREYMQSLISRFGLR